MSCAELRESAFLYAAGDLDPAESAELRTHLDDGCPRCLGALAEAEAALANLALELEPLAPPERARAALRVRVGDTVPAQSARLVARAPARAQAAWLRPALAAGVAALVAFLAGSLLPRGTATPPEPAAPVTAEAEQHRAVMAIVASRNVRVIELRGPALGFRGVARIYWEYKTGGCYLHVTKLAPIGPGTALVLWFTDADGEPLRAGALELEPDGVGTLLTEMPSGIDTQAPVYVTAEPDANAARPSAEPVLSGAIS